MPETEPKRRAETQKCDILIVGSGMVGATMACCLSTKLPHLKIVIIDAFPVEKMLDSYQGDFQEKYTPSFDNRSTVLSTGSIRNFESMGLWQAFSQKAESIETINVSEKGKFASVRLKAKDYGVNAFGKVTDNKWIGGVLLENIMGLANVELITPASVSELSFSEKEVSVLLKKESETLTIDTKLLLVSDGANSKTCQLLGIEYESFDYEQIGLIANVKTEKAHQGNAFERFTDEGPIAFLPLMDTNPDGAGEVGESCRSALILTAHASQASQLKSCSDAELAKIIEKKFGQRLGKVQEIGKRDVYPLKLTRALEQVRSKVVVLGNAAHTLHPIAGQGFNLSVRDISELSHLLVEADKNNLPLGELKTLQAYLDHRHLDQTMTIEFSDKLNKLFARENSILSLSRNLGLVGLDAVPGFKKMFVKQTMGMQAIY